MKALDEQCDSLTTTFTSIIDLGLFVVQYFLTISKNIKYHGAHPLKHCGVGYAYCLKAMGFIFSIISIDCTELVHVICILYCQ